MPFRRHRKCGRKMSCCNVLRRHCLDSLPRYCMPPYPFCIPHPAYLPASSSRSDCSCGEESFCTVENCRNAPMCLSTRPMYCPYGSNQRDRLIPPISGRPQYGAGAAEGNYRRGLFNDSLSAPSPFFILPPPFPPDYGRIGGDFPWVHDPHEISPLVPSEVPPEVAPENAPEVGTDVTQDDFPEMSFRASSYHNFPRSCPRRLSNAAPQFVTSSPVSRNVGRFDPRLSTLHRIPLDTPYCRPRVDNTFQPLPSTEIADDREVLTRHNLTNLSQSRDRICQRDDGRSLKDAFYRRLQYSTNDGSCNVDAPCSKSHVTHYTPQTCDSAGVRIPTGPVGSCLPDASGVSCAMRDHQTGPDTCPPDLHSSAGVGLVGGSKCPCRYPPSYNHLSCAGNISGSCSCGKN